VHGTNRISPVWRQATMRIETARLVLREFAADDWRAVQAYQCDPRYLVFYGRQPPTDTEAQAFVGRFLEWQADEPRWRMQLAICRPGSAEPIGNVGLRRAAAGAPSADMGYELDPAFWGRGYATEAARALLDHGFRVLGLHRIHAHCLAENAASARVLEKLGMRLEGRLIQAERVGGRWHDVLLYGTLAHEWTPTDALGAP
jgi:[ribosomal protein S5]-alanine N-acetyltransferase